LYEGADDVEGWWNIYKINEGQFHDVQTIGGIVPRPNFQACLIIRSLEIRDDTLLILSDT
jgi:hypothetical protein